MFISATIRTHGAFVGVLLAIEAISPLVLGSFSLLHGEVDNINLDKELLILDTPAILFAIIFWIGFLKRIRWCLTVTVGYIAVWLVLVFVGLIVLFPEENIGFKEIFILSWILIWFTLNQYVLLVTLQLRKDTQAITGRESQEE